jgi:hypothetical protein
MENRAKLLEDSLLVIWNSRDSASRLTAMKDVYASNIAFYETNESAAIIGYKAINELIAKLQEQWPSEFQFELTAPSNVNHEVQQIAWKLGVPGQAPVATGMDIAFIEDQKIKSLYLFLNTPETPK